MSHNLSPTVTVNNTNIYIDSLNSSMGGSTFGLSPVPPGTPVPAATQAALQQMLAVVRTKFTALFPSQALPLSNNDGGYMGPWSANIAGTAPACTVKQITMDFKNWGLPTIASLPTDMAQEVTEEISAQGGSAGFASGTYQVTGSEFIYWVVGYATVSITQSETGILYVFCAAEGINI